MNRFSEIPSLLEAIEELRAKQEACETEFSASIAPGDAADCSRNLLHYVAMRREDLRPVQTALISRGLTSLGGAEGSAQYLVQALSRTLHALMGKEAPHYPTPPSDPVKAAGLLDQRAEALLGRPSGKRRARIMVTMPSEAANEPRLIQDLLESGMDVMRINCAHDGPAEWAAMASHLADATRRLGRPCKVYTDLGGPKLRTGEIESAGQVLKLRPRRSPMGDVTESVRFWLSELVDEVGGQESFAGSVVLPVAEGSLSKSSKAKSVRLRDARGSARELDVIARIPGAIQVECEQTLYLETGGSFDLRDKNDDKLDSGFLGRLPDLVLPLILHVGEELVVVPDTAVGRHAERNDDGSVSEPARIPCTLPEVFGAVKPGQPIFFDDGKIGGVIESCSPSQFTVRITRAAVSGSKLRPGKGINLPDTDLPISPLTEKDRADLQHVAAYADIVGLSFVRSGGDVVELRNLLAGLKRGDCGIVAKIETRPAFQNIVSILLEGLRCPSFGVMIARGDLAVELGFERLSEAQEEILWMCEAAHVPVIWATQILETLAKDGLPTRAEVTDAASAVNAECAMLNKGPHILEAVHFLSGLLERAGEHHSKKHNLLRKLSIARIG